MKPRNHFKLLLVVTAALFGLAVLSGCSKPAGKSPATSQAGSPGGSGSETDNGQEAAAPKTLAIGEKGINEVVSEVAVAQVAKTASLTSPEATKLLQIGAPGESPEVEKRPEAGNDFLMVTFTYKAKKDKVGIHPADIKLVDGDGREYPEVETSGHGGVYNQDPPKAGTEASVTAVYEVPAGAQGLTLTYQPFGDVALTFEVR